MNERVGLGRVAFGWFSFSFSFSVLGLVPCDCTYVLCDMICFPARQGRLRGVMIISAFFLRGTNERCQKDEMGFTLELLFLHYFIRKRYEGITILKVYVLRDVLMM